MIQLRTTCWSSVQFCLIPGVDHKGQTKPLCIADLQEKVYHLRFFESFVLLLYIKKKHYRQGNRKNIITINFKFKNSSNHIVLSLLKSIDINEERTLILIFFFKIKRKRLQSIIFRITLWNRRVSFPFREM